MTPAQIRADHTLTARAGCSHCRNSRTLRLGVVPARYQHTVLQMIPFRCRTCGELAEDFHVERWTGGRFATVWRWPAEPNTGLGDDGDAVDVGKHAIRPQSDEVG